MVRENNRSNQETKLTRHPSTMSVTDSGGSSFHSSTRSSRTSAAAAAIVVVASTAIGYCAFRLVSDYGWDGAFWYVWEGSPHRPAIRQRAEALEARREDIRVAEADITLLERTLERARNELAIQGSVLDETSSEELLRRWQERLNEAETSPSLPDLQFRLAQLSDGLDKTAAQVDDVPSRGEAEIKSRKKVLSKSIVQLMDRTDALIRVYEATKT